MNRDLAIRPEAEAEMANAFDWLEERHEGLGAAFLLCVEAALNSIMRSPQHYPQVHKGVRRALTRRFPYEIFFLANDERIIVLAAFHAKRNPKNWIERT